MKKIVNLSLVFVMALLIGIISVNAKEYYYVNDNGITFTKEEYDFFTAMYYDGYQAYMTSEDMAKFDNVIKDASLVETKEYDESKVFVPSGMQTRGNVHETNAKRLKISGNAQFDNFAKELGIIANIIIEMPDIEAPKRMDFAKEKRVDWLQR